MNDTPSSKRNNPIPLRSAFSRWVSEQVRFSDTDMLGHVNNASFAVYCETGRTQCILRHVMGDDTKGLVFVMARLTIDFTSEVHWPAQIDIGTAVLSIGRTSFQVGQGLFVGDQCVAIAEASVVLIDAATRKPCVIPDVMRTRMNELLITPAG